MLICTLSQEPNKLVRDYEQPLVTTIHDGGAILDSSIYEMRERERE